MTKKKAKHEKPEQPPYKYPWNKDDYESKEDAQWYDSSFFEPYVKELEPTIPSDYSDPILEEENKLLHTPTEDFPKASPQNPNFPALYKKYDELLNTEFKDVMIAICIPSFNGNIDLNSAVSLFNAFKPRHRFHSLIGHNIDIQRNQLVNMALNFDDVTHIFFWDSDVILPPFALMRLLRRKEPIVCGMYPMKAPPYVPLIIKRPKNDNGERKFNYYVTITPELVDKVFPIDGAGAGCLLIEKEALLNIEPPWFQVTPFNHSLAALGEDLHFFDKAQDKGYIPKMDLSIRCDHSIGHISYPTVFIQDHIRLGDSSKRLISTWNRNAILWSQDMPLFDASKNPDLKKEKK